MKKIILAALIAATSLIVNDCHAQSFMQKAKAKAKVVADKKTSPNTKPNTTKGAATSAKSDMEIYHTLDPEKSQNGKTTNQIVLEKGVYNGSKYIGDPACEKGCAPVGYKYQDEPSTTLGIKIYFSRLGLYLMEYDNNSYISVRPTNNLLGEGVWDEFSFSNFYSTNALKIKTMSKAKIEAFAIKISKEILASSGSSKSDN
ncbi:MAG: hypothetical protein HRT73_10495 [Flavobacteriales bacterium]|nr:hypothetical protein [Flavobacteriales bacterium]